MCDTVVVPAACGVGEAAMNYLKLKFDSHFGIEEFIENNTRLGGLAFAHRDGYTYVRTPWNPAQVMEQMGVTHLESCSPVDFDHYAKIASNSVFDRLGL